ncbi:hypothetical protein O998_02455 [Anaplasma phagocytophilum str. Norway variant1]|uniref:Quinolinate phosphoribosyl transferase C-terminal domain-containing protein n=1 Tax=Anaplasma phagocytophilum str. Norway variant1 TaxID=1392506 RepID=A0A7H9DYM9_ANAPH|nr:hypothetical protein O998_02455 [Anaplasma phagocytophilum str. Norway variant1]
MYGKSASYHETNAIICSTSKTCPGQSKSDLYAEHIGGGESFRTGLFDRVLMKDNHAVYWNAFTR